MFDIIFSKVSILFLFLLLFFILVFLFLFTRKPIIKIIVLAFAYNIVLFFIIYNLYLFNIENNIIDITILIIFSCLLNTLSGTFIINNIMKNNNVK